jgi:hypothetical protein
MVIPSRDRPHAFDERCVASLPDAKVLVGQRGGVSATPFDRRRSVAPSYTGRADIDRSSTLVDEWRAINDGGVDDGSSSSGPTTIYSLDLTG